VFVSSNATASKIAILLQANAQIIRKQTATNAMMAVVPEKAVMETIGECSVVCVCVQIKFFFQLVLMLPR